MPDRRKSFEGLVLRALNIQLNIIARYSGPKADEIVAEWKADAREFLRDIHEDAEALAAAEIVAYHEETVKLARSEGRIP